MATERANGPIRVYLEGAKKVFACALDWPGWCRAGRGEEAALEALTSYASRYAVVAEEASVPFPRELAGDLFVVERLPGSATTEFGALDKPASADREPLTR